MSKRMLYYPVIDIMDETWIKNTLFYWDQVSSIVPYKGYSMHENMNMLKDSGCYKPVYPEDIFAKNMDGFLDTLEQKLYKLYRSNHKEKDVVYVNDRKLFYMHGLEIMDQYEEIKHLFECAPSVNGEWRRMGKGAATAYMMTLAEFAVKGDDDMTIGTDKASNISCLKDGYGKTDDENCTFEFIFNNYLPMPSEETSLEEVLAFKRKYKRSLVDFQAEVTKLQKDISTCTDDTKVKEVFAAFESKVNEAVRIAEIPLKESCLKYVEGSLKSGVKCLLPVDTALILGGIANASNLGEFLTTSINPATLAINAAGAAGFFITKAIVGDIKHRKRNLPYIIHAHKKGMVTKRSSKSN